MTWTTRVLADFILSAGQASWTAHQQAKRCLLDLLASAWAGGRTDSARILAETALEVFSSGPSSLWFTGRRTAAAGAVLANAAAASALDLDDGHRAAAGHPGAVIIPAVLAAAEETDSSSREILSAVVLGYEVGCRVAAARDLEQLVTLSTGRWGGFGSAAAVGCLRRLKADQLAQALAIAGVLSPDLAAAGYSRVMGNMVKEGIPWAAQTGLLAVRLAETGFTGPLDILDHPAHYRRERILAGLGESWAVNEVYFKPYACCRWIHAALDGFLGLVEENDLPAAEIEEVEVNTFERALRLNHYPDPDSLEAAQYSLPFCLAVAALAGPDALLPLDEKLLRRPDLIAWARKVKLAVDPRLDRLFPSRSPARVVLQVKSKKYAREILDPRGDQANPLSPPELEAKFRKLSRAGLSPERQDEVIALAAGFENHDPRRLLAVLRDG
ncbi:MAG: MmgE/PrpD family protein [Thermodesulfobacteriota bacterium]